MLFYFVCFLTCLGVPAPGILLSFASLLDTLTLYPATIKMIELVGLEISVDSVKQIWDSFSAVSYPILGESLVRRAMEVSLATGLSFRAIHWLVKKVGVTRARMYALNILFFLGFVCFGWFAVGFLFQPLAFILLANGFLLGFLLYIILMIAAPLFIVLWVVYLSQIFAEVGAGFRVQDVAVLTNNFLMVFLMPGKVLEYFPYAGKYLLAVAWLACWPLWVLHRLGALPYYIRWVERDYQLMMERLEHPETYREITGFWSMISSVVLFYRSWHDANDMIDFVTELNFATRMVVYWAAHAGGFLLPGFNFATEYRQDCRIFFIRLMTIPLSFFLAIFGAPSLVLLLTIYSIIWSVTWAITNPYLAFMQILHPIFTLIWCQTASWRSWLFTKSLDSPLKPSKVAKWWADLWLYCFEPKHKKNPLVTTLRDGTEFRFRDDVRDTLHGTLLFEGLHKLIDPRTQNFFAFVFLIYLIYKIMGLLINIPVYVVRITMNYFERVFYWLFFFLLLPDCGYAIILGYSYFTYDYLSALYDNHPGFVTPQMTVAIKGFLAGLWSLSIPEERLEEFSQLAFPKMNKFDRYKTLNLFRVSAIRVVRRLDDFKLPEFIQAQWMSPDPDMLKGTYQTLLDIGWPGIDQEYIDSIKEIGDSAYLGEWASANTHLLAYTNFVVPLLRKKVGVPAEMSNWSGILWAFGQVPGYFHTAGYNSVEAEIRSTARYWTGNNPPPFSEDEALDLIDGAWAGVKKQFADSRLTSFSSIFGAWEKKYNLGFGFRTKRGHKTRMLKRFEAIQKVGGKAAFLDLWERTFKLAPKLVPVAPVFAKQETLKLKKFLTRSVRTIIGSAITHHILTTVFNYQPNHNYWIWETPMKVGMSFNGQNFGRLWNSLDKHTFIWAGDMTAFDSTLPAPILHIVRDIRKKGYESHSDYHRISTLIDVAYDQLLHHPLGIRSTGTVHLKDQGFTTGHSATSPDNSLGLFVCYLFAWRRVTGLRCREFLTYNTLVNFGDDHVLGWEPVFGWSPENAARAMAQLGVVMRDEAPGEFLLPNELLTESLARRRWEAAGRPGTFEEFYKVALEVRRDKYSRIFGFLGKIPLEKTPKIEADLRRAGVELPYPLATCHDPRRLVGKITGQMFNDKHPYVRRERLISYLDLCAHHEDIYAQVVQSINTVDIKYAQVWKRDGSWGRRSSIPSYPDVIRKWYNPKKHVVPTEGDRKINEVEDESDLYEEAVHWFAGDVILDNVIAWLADAPTLISPRVVGASWIQGLLRLSPRTFSWPAQLLAQVNGALPGSMGLRDLMEPTPYRFFSMPFVTKVIPSVNFTTLLIRHWLFTFFMPSNTRRGPTIFDIPLLLDLKLANYVYALTGRTIQVLQIWSFDFVAAFWIAVLSHIHFPDFLGWVKKPLTKATIPTFSMVVSMLYYELLRTLQPLGAVDFQPYFAEVDAIVSKRSGTIVSAPTGTGKSTTLVAKTFLRLRCQIIVIVPRVIVALGVTDWMQQINPGLNIAALCEGGTATGKEDIIYATPMAFLSRKDLHDLTPRLFIVDEAHIQEPLYYVVLAHLRFLGHPRILMTATPLAGWPERGGVPLEVPATSKFTVAERDVTLNTIGEYAGFVRNLLRDLPDHVKILVFVPSLAQASRIADFVPKSSILSSRNHEIDPTSRLYVSTNVSDAGLTIPDVGVVVTLDIDVHVSTTRTWTTRDGEHYPLDTKKVIYYRLNDQTVKQRRGRTGRTCDGIFYKVHLAGRYGAKTLTSQDWLDALGHLMLDFKAYTPLATDRTVRWPENILPDDLRSARPWWREMISSFAGEVGDLMGQRGSVMAQQTLGLNQNGVGYRGNFWYEDSELPPPEEVLGQPFDKTFEPKLEMFVPSTVHPNDLVDYHKREPDFEVWMGFKPQPGVTRDFLWDWSQKASPPWTQKMFNWLTLMFACDPEHMWLRMTKMQWSLAQQDYVWQSVEEFIKDYQDPEMLDDPQMVEPPPPQPQEVKREPLIADATPASFIRPGESLDDYAKIWDVEPTLAVWIVESIGLPWDEFRERYRLLDKDSMLKQHFASVAKKYSQEVFFKLAKEILLGVDTETANETLQEQEFPAYYNVPGLGLDCGLYAMQALIWSHRGVRTPLSLLRQMAQDISRASDDFQENFYSADIIMKILWYHYGISVSIVGPDSVVLIPHLPLRSGYVTGRLKLEGAHYWPWVKVDVGFLYENPEGDAADDLRFRMAIFAAEFQNEEEFRRPPSAVGAAYDLLWSTDEPQAENATKRLLATPGVRYNPENVEELLYPLAVAHLDTQHYGCHFDWVVDFIPKIEDPLRKAFVLEYAMRKGGIFAPEPGIYIGGTRLTAIYAAFCYLHVAEYHETLFKNVSLVTCRDGVVKITSSIRHFTSY